MKEDVLPEGWGNSKLLDLCDIKTGKVDANHHSNDGIYPFFTCALEPLKSKTYSFDDELIILPGNGANVGTVFYYNGKIEAYQRTYVLHKIQANPKFIYFHLLYLWKERTAKKQFGSATNYIRMSNFEEYSLPLPPLPEQQYLSKKLTALLDEVAQTKQRLDTIPALLKQFRQSVLADAVSGRLTEEWRENKEYELIDKLTFPKGWMKSTLGKEFNYGSCKKKSPDEILNQEWVLELEDIEKDNSNILNKITNATRQAKSTKNVFKKGDVLYGKLRPYLNKIVIADGDGVCTTEIIPISSNERICNQYLFYWLKSPYFFNYVNEITYGVNMPRLGTQDGKKAIIVFPPKEEQTQIVQKVETYFALADEIETQVNAALENVNLLTQSILAKAFSGELSAAWRTQQAVKN